MIKAINVKSRLGNYPVYAGQHLLGKTGHLINALEKRTRRKPQKARHVMIVTQKAIARHHLEPLYASLNREGFKTEIYFLQEGEKAKSQKECFRLYRTLLKKEFERKDLLLALGGGVVGDLTGFCASTYMRGIPFVNVGTTLLAQVDSSIGGKTGINLDEGKNLVGTFYPPRVVISDVTVLKTLPRKELRASFAEVIKYGIIRNAAFFRKLEKTAGRLLTRDRVLLSEVVSVCSRIKAEVVSRDEQEQSGERMILNYGHTFGHAFEKVSRYRMLHGEGVALGMICAARLAVMLKLFSPSEEKRQRHLIRQLGLPVSLAPLKAPIEKIMAAMRVDKKRAVGNLRFVLPVKIGQVTIKEIPDLKQVKKVLIDLGAKVS